VKEYVAGFLFKDSPTSGLSVVLIEKKRPAWQKGLLNGVGGKIEKAESMYDAMVREFREETGLLVYNWRLFCTLYSSDFSSWRVFFFSSYVPGRNYRALQQMTDEQVSWYDSDEVNRLRTIDNLRWLVPMAKAKSPVFGTVREL
jgi:8-oxo-dGTP diphosphatase